MAARAEVTAEDLREAQRTYADAQAVADEERYWRDRAVQEALSAGWTHAQIAEATGLTRGRVGQIAQKSARVG